MGERKVLNKYYPPDFDPAKIPRMKKPKNEQFKVRLMAPFNMRCITCGVFIYKATKFNARKETVEGEEYLGIKVFRFYIRCPRCHQEITFKTDPQNADYLAEHGATRNFDIFKHMAGQVEEVKKKKEDEEMGNAMKALENRTKQSKREMDLMDALEEIKDLKARQQHVDVDIILAAKDKIELPSDEEDDEKLIQSIFGSSADPEAPVYVKRLEEDSDEEGKTKKAESAGVKRPTDELLSDGGDEKRPKVSEKEKVKQLIKPVAKKPGISLGIVKKTPISSTGPPDAKIEPPTAVPPKAPQASGGLGLVGGYGSSDDSD